MKFVKRLEIILALMWLVRKASERSELRAKRAAHEVSEAVLYLQNTFVC